MFYVRLKSVWLSMKNCEKEIWEEWSRHSLAWNEAQFPMSMLHAGKATFYVLCNCTEPDDKKLVNDFRLWTVFVYSGECG